MSPRQVVEEWVSRFNRADVEGLAALYKEDATNHQVVMAPLAGRDAIREMFRTEFGRATMTCIVENLFEDGEWAILEMEGSDGLAWLRLFPGAQRSDRVSARLFRPAVVLSITGPASARELSRADILMPGLKPGPPPGSSGTSGILAGMRRGLLAAMIVAACATTHPSAQPRQDAAAIEAETLQHFQALLRLDTSNPPGNEVLAVEYVKQVLDKAGIRNQVFASDAKRPNLVARIKGNGKKRPLLVMGHTDVVTVDPKKWTHPPFGAVRDGGYVYGRGTVDDKDNLVASLMLVLMLKRSNVPLDRDVIFLAESGEAGYAAGRCAIHDRQAFRRDRRGVLPRGGRWRGPFRWTGAASERRHDGEGAAFGRTDRARSGRPWVGAAAVECRRPADCRSGQDRHLDAAAPGERNDRIVLPHTCDDGVAGRRAALSGRAQSRSERAQARSGVDAAERAAALVDAAHFTRADHSRGRLSLQRDSLGGQGHARCPASPR